MQSGSPYSPLRVVAAPEVFFILGRPGDEKSLSYWKAQAFTGRAETVFSRR